MSSLRKPPESWNWRGLPVLAALGGLPLFWAPWGYEQFVMPKMVWVEVWAGVIFAAAVLRAAVFSRPVGLSLNGVGLFLALFFAWHIALAPLSDSPSLAWDRVGWLLAALVVACGWQEWAKGRRRRIPVTLWVLIAAGTTVAAWVLWQDAMWHWAERLPPWLRGRRVAVNRLGDWRGGISAGLGNTDHIAVLLATLYLPLLLLMRFQCGRLKCLVLLAALWLWTAALIVCWSVGANGSLMLGALVLLLTMGRQGRRRFFGRRGRKRLAAWAGGCLLVIVWLVTDNPLNPHRPGIFREAFGSERWIAGGPTRGVIWLNTLEMIRRNKLLGVGPGCFAYSYPRYASPFMPAGEEWMRYQGAYTNAAHNTVLQAWAELGPVGVALLAWAVFLAFRALRLRACRARGRPVTAWIARGALAALAVLCLTSVMTFPLQLPVSTVLFFCLLLLGQALPSMDGRSAMPALVSEGRRATWTLHMRDMRTPTAVEIFFCFSRGMRQAIAAGAVLAAATWAALAARPLAADIVYHRARLARGQAEAMGLRESPRAESLFRLALAIYPDHHDCRSAFTTYLLENERYEECLLQLERVFERLDSTELYLRRSMAHRGLGSNFEAEHDLAIFLSRRPGAAFAGAPSASETGAPSQPFRQGPNQ